MLLVALLLVAIEPATLLGASQGAGAGSVDPQQEDELKREKLEEEVRKLRLENDRLESFWSRVPLLGTFVTALVAVIGVILTLWKQITESSRLRKAETEQRERESLRRFDEMFTSTIANLGSDSTALQASAAGALLTFLKPRYREFHEEVFAVVVANLKIDRPRAVKDLLTRVFEEAVRIWAARLHSDAEAGRLVTRNTILDLSRSFLRRVDLEDLDLRHAAVDLAFADMKGANLTGAQLPKARGYGVRLESARLSRADLQEARFNASICTKALFHGTNLISATFKEAKLSGAQFFEGRLQSAHFEDADLRSAEFKGADLNDAFFRGARFDTTSQRSLTRALNWQKAHYDPGLMERLEAIAAQGD